MHRLCHVVCWVVLRSLPPAMPSQFESLSWRPANGGCWGQRGQGIQTTWGQPDCDAENLTVISFCPLSFFLCVSVWASVLPAGLKSQHQTSTSQSLWAGERRRCQDVQHQKVSTMSLLIYSYTLFKKKKKKRQTSQGVLKWLLLIMSDISGQLCSIDDFWFEKTLMWRKVKIHFPSLFVQCKDCELYNFRHYLNLYTLSRIFFSHFQMVVPL